MKDVQSTDYRVINVTKLQKAMSKIEKANSELKAMLTKSAYQINKEKV